MLNIKHKNVVWNAFIIMLAASCTWHAGKAFIKIYSYAKLTEKTSADSIHWSIIPTKNKYLLQAAYLYTVDGKTFGQNTLFTDPAFLNPWAAEQAVKNHLSKNWQVWYRSNKPHISSLQKKLPLKELFSFFIVCGLLIYFIGLKIYVSKKYE